MKSLINTLLLSALMIFPSACKDPTIKTTRTTVPVIQESNEIHFFQNGLAYKVRLNQEIPKNTQTVGLTITYVDNNNDNILNPGEKGYYSITIGNKTYVATENETL